MLKNPLDRLHKALRATVIAYAGTGNGYLVSALTQVVAGAQEEIAGIKEILSFYERPDVPKGLPEFAVHRAEHRAEMEELLAERRANLEAYMVALTLVKRNTG